ncbi:halomucin [Elysia marginata]|uniref:Halomucin n=1 Tax=Elysia marginata TaxID=1093978 RepID=A0AAV4GR46_9GAST|nr:halomucin [Elysia marginata]
MFNLFFLNRSFVVYSFSWNGSQAETGEGRQKQREFFKLELQRLQSSLKRESSKIHAPQKKAYTPYVFNTLEPYYNTYTTRFLIELVRKAFWVGFFFTN